jgi:hypothetical protein
MLIPHPLPPVLSISVKTKGLGRSISASISKQRTYKSFVLIFLRALPKTVFLELGRDGDSQFGKQQLPHPLESFGTRESRFEAGRPSLRFRVARWVYVSQVNYGTWYQIVDGKGVLKNSNNNPSTISLDYAAKLLNIGTGLILSPESLSGSARIL